MISTGAFQTEMDASHKQPTLAKKFAAVWEKKNAKAARAGGVSLMALSLAACGSSDDTSSTSTSSTTTTTTTPTSQSYSLTIGVDSVTGGAGADTITAGTTATTDSNGAVVNNATLSATDTIDGGAGSDTLNVTEVAAMTVPGVTVSNVETINLKSAAGVTANLTSGFTGVETLNVTATGATNIDALVSIDVNLTATTVGAVATAVDAAKNVTITNSGVTDTNATIAVGAATAAKGAVSVTQTTSFADGAGDVAPTIGVTGGTTVNITQNLAGASDAAQATDATSETFTGGAVTVTGTADTTAATVTQTAANTAVNYAVATAATATATGTLAVAGETGVVNGAVTITDANSASLLDAGTLTTATLNNYGASTVNSGALTTVNISGTGGTLGLTAGALTTAAVNTLTINASAATAGAITADADYTTINVAGSTGTSTIANLTATGATTLNVSGDAKVTFTAQTLAAVTDINVTNTAGVSLGTALATSTAFDSVGGADAVTLGATNKAISTGAGNDTVTVNVAALGVSATLGNGSIDAGTGTDTLVMTGANAVTATASATFGNTISGFEVLQVTGDNNNNASAVNLAQLDNINSIVVAGDQDYTFGGVSPGASLTVQGTAIADTDTTLTMVGASGSSDSISVTLANNTGAAQDFGTLTAAAVESIAITTSDTGTVAAGRQYATIDILDVTAADATSITVSGNNGLNMGTNTAAKVTTFDASGVAGDNSTEDIAANLAVTYASGNTTAGANLTLTGGAGNDTLTANLNDDTMSGGAGNDILAGSTGTDTIDGGAGTDTYTMTAAQIAANIEGAGTGTSTGVAVNLGATAVTGAAVLAATGKYLSQGQSLAVNTVAYVFDGDLSTNSTVVDTLTSVENVDLGTAGVHYVMGSATANTIDLGAAANVTAADFVNGGAGSDTILVMADNNGTGAVFDDLAGIETITVEANSTATHDIIIGLTYTAANTDALTISAAALTNAGATLTIDASADGEVDGALTITGGAGADTITSGDGIDTITGGGGRDVMTSHGGVDTFVFNAYTDLVLAAAATIGDTDSDSGTSTTEEMTDAVDFDLIAFGTGDKIDVSNFDADATVAGHQAFTVTFDATAVAGASDGISAGTDHTIVAQRGVWDATNGDFTHTATGSDTLLVFDDGTNVGYAVVDAAVLAAGDFILA